MFHINEIDWSQDTSDEKSTSHYLQMRNFLMKNTRIITYKVEHDKGGNKVVKAKIPFL